MNQPTKPLSMYELETLRELAEGKTYEGISKNLFIGVDAVKRRLKQTYSKLDARTGCEAVARAFRAGLID